MLDEPDYNKAPLESYLQLADAIDACSAIDQISIEDTHRRNDPKLFAHFKRTKVILGVLRSSETHVESVGEIVEHLESAMEYMPPRNIIAAPDCGLAMLSEDLIERKLRNMVEACRQLKNRLN
mmetsp:Transcript_28729/g.13298  ORF Transcript_28729/g.13298 Transcript_28729/m.13298 type:complete len:123 (+) Transcript_28729:498-866(+)|eukprot:CAMPEP_0201282558 /NCGR_PEP_ID=MMETSP1317-20130820/5988_1 /ASSEMBLY_ACC=CAM_ASM_000770 /TAXON_ID=187299 /ORGANISM="Undescribed Undescribed, Strain Undescribed" /LENGTH=122 /DNA_ID=CAMNT_0047595613 /DNA_START=737 /DNA_END=1105 /DNA_ORIENTATION=-